MSNSTLNVHETEEIHANLSHVVDCFTCGIYHSRETGPPEQLQRQVRRFLAQSRPSAAPQNFSKAVANPVFHPSLPREPHEHRPGHDFAQKIDRCIPSLLPALGCGAAPVTQDISRATAPSAVPVETTGRCPRLPGEDAGRRLPRWFLSGVR